MQVYEKVRAYIDGNGIKQRTVAQKANLSVSTFNAMMNGKRIMYADDLRAICCALRVGPETFIEVHSPPLRTPPTDRPRSTTYQQKGRYGSCPDRCRHFSPAGKKQTLKAA